MITGVSPTGPGPPRKRGFFFGLYLGYVCFSNRALMSSSQVLWHGVGRVLRPKADIDKRMISNMAETQKIPWKRLSVEAAAIVVSILLAFAIDAWWDERQERAEEREVLESLYAEFEANRDEVASVISFHDREIRSIETLMELRQNEILALPAETVAEMLGSLAIARTFDAVRGSVDALHGSGKLGILRDRELREALTTFVNVVDDAVEDAIYLGQSSIKVWNEIVRNGGPWRTKFGDVTAEECAVPLPPSICYFNDALDFLPVATPQDFLRLRNNAVLMGYVYQNKVYLVFYSGELRDVQNRIEFVLRLLEENLKSNVN